MNKRREAAAQTRILLAWGFAWGAAEATLGHLLHWIPVPGLAGAVLAPLGIWAMAAAVRATDRPASAFVVSTLAAAVKMADIFLPGRGPVMTLRPALAILAEGLVVWLASTLAAKAFASRAARRPV
jgi:hypothetical protein